MKPVPVTPEEGIDRSQLASRVAASQTFACSQSDPAGPAQRHEVSPTLLQLERQPLSAYDDNPVFDEASAARFIGVTADCLKKWRQRKQGPDYIQYGRNGVVRYELNALMEFRDRHRIRIGHRN
jgi:hypothetical protein